VRATTARPISWRFPALATCLALVCLPSPFAAADVLGAPTPPSSATTSEAIAPQLAELQGKTYVAVAGFSDNGAVTLDLNPGAYLEITFRGTTAEAASNCGPITYDHLSVDREGGGRATWIDFGEPAGPRCEMVAGLSAPAGVMLWGSGDSGRAGVGNGFTSIVLQEKSSLLAEERAQADADHERTNGWQTAILIFGGLGLAAIAVGAVVVLRPTAALRPTKGRRGVGPSS
jgi:hypothetical protein